MFGMHPVAGRGDGPAGGIRELARGGHGHPTAIQTIRPNHPARPRMIEPAELRSPAVAVFVDETGRKRRRARRVGWVLAGLVGVYFVLLIASIARAPWVPHVALPGVGNALPATSPRLPPALGPRAVVSPAPDLGRLRAGRSTSTTPVPARAAVPGSAGGSVSAPGTAPSPATPPATATGPTTSSPSTRPSPATTRPSARPTPSSVVPPGRTNTSAPGRGRP